MKFVIGALLWTMLLASCSNPGNVTGRYEATDPTGGDQDVVLEIDPGGKAVWIRGDEEVRLTWEQRGQSITFHSRKGGVFEAEVRGGGLVTTLPGVGRITLRQP